MAVGHIYIAEYKVAGSVAPSHTWLADILTVKICSFRCAYYCDGLRSSIPIWVLRIQSEEQK
jgi:hypothetical protein